MGNLSYRLIHREGGNIKMASVSLQLLSFSPGPHPSFSLENLPHPVYPPPNSTQASQNPIASPAPSSTPPPPRPFPPPSPRPPPAPVYPPAALGPSRLSVSANSSAAPCAPVQPRSPRTTQSAGGACSAT